MGQRIPVTLGNIIGGAGIVGAGYWAMYLKHTPGTDISIEKEQEEIDIAEEYAKGYGYNEVLVYTDRKAVAHKIGENVVRKTICL